MVSVNEESVESWVGRSEYTVTAALVDWLIVCEMVISPTIPARVPLI
jgi:hypothetical protein